MTRDDDVAFMSSAMATLHAWLAEPWAEDALTLTLILTLTLNLTLDGYILSHSFRTVDI